MMTRLFQHFAAPLATAALLLSAGSATAGEESAEDSAAYEFPKAGESRLIGAEEALGIKKTHGAELLIVNYWATWCGPCVEELPYFIALSKAYPEEKIRVVGYSLDFAEVIESDVDPFLKEKGVPYANLVLEVDGNEYIPRVSEDWVGALPATFFYNADGEKVAEVLTVVTADELFEKTAGLIRKLGIDTEVREPPAKPEAEAGGE